MPPLPSFWTSRYSSTRLGGTKLGGLRLAGTKLGGLRLAGPRLGAGSASAARGRVSAPPGRRAACVTVGAELCFTVT
ncbi:hypothetical protein [Sorangium sp. So ce233]|uniref:hypothetical protein n=1 Tax=Sorangium sp. So ce233 TaxID=3133290 RepID=UPI003F6010FA